MEFGIYVRKNTTNNAKKQLFGSLKCRKRQFTLLSSYSLLLHFHTPRLDFHNPDVHFHTIQLSALHYIRCVLALYSVRLNRINSVREPCLFGSGTELTVYGLYCISLKSSTSINREYQFHRFQRHHTTQQSLSPRGILPL